MKLETTITPRADGTVIVHGLDGQDHVFANDGTGVLVCEVGHDATVAHLLRQGDNFFPADEADYDRAEELMGKAAGGKQDGGSTSGASAGSEVDGDGDDDDDEADPNALPIEAGTPPASAKPKAGAAAKTRSRARKAS